VEVSRRFGPLEPHVKKRFHHPDSPLMLVLSNVVEDGRAIGARDGGTFWHSDMSFAPRPARATLLYGVQIPDEGGDTLFADLTRAYEDLPPELKARLEGLQALHDYAKADEISAMEGGARSPLTAEERRLVPPVRHPVVRTHPETGRKALYVTPGYTRSLVGMSEAESAALMAQIFAHCLQPRYELRYRWSVGDVVVWDNAAVMHSATTRDLPPDKHRTLWRTVISGDAPF
ncbi:MAG TPA: TauD/TfdA family dioxygenase, partial [Methylomirabilota bacterium]|nr:TauD/TfdA family dioxygenase [Methylomirabilota bacterium]